MVRLLRYWFYHGLPTGFRSFRMAVVNWMDLMWFTENQSQYTIFRSDDPLEECLLFFWDSLGDNTLSIETLQEIEEVLKGLEDGTIKIVPLDLSMLEPDAPES